MGKIYYNDRAYAGGGSDPTWGNITGTLSDQTDLQSALNDKADTSSLATVATTGNYSDLSGKPTLATVATSGSYNDLSNKPTLATVATSGSYNDLSNKPTIPAAQVNSDWNASSGVAEILNKPTLATVATSGSYNDLSNKPTIPAAQVNSDWTASSGVTQILNKPSLATVATSGSYNDLSNKPTIPAAQVNSDWNASSGVAQILNKPTIPTVTDTYSGTSSDGMSGKAVKQAIDALDVTDSAVAGQYVSSVSESNGKITVTRATIPAGGHTMLPTPSSSVNESAVVNAINTAITTDGGANDDVASLYGVGVWSNEKNVTIEIHGDITTIDATGIGDWKEDNELVNPTAQDESGWGWVYVPELIGMGSNNTVDFKLTFDPVACGGPVTLGGYILDDTTGYLCIKFGNEIASPSTAIIGIEVIYKRNGRRVVGS